MQKSFALIFLLSAVFASSSVHAMSKAESMEQRKSRPRIDLDTGEVTPEPVDNLLKHYSYVIPYLPKGTKQVYKAPEAGPCTQEGVVFKDAKSSRGCYIFSSRDSIFKIQIHSQSSSFSYMSRIWKKVNGEWILWAEFDTGGQATYASTEAARFAGRSAPGKVEDQPQYSRENRTVPEIPAAPSLGTILDGFIRKSR